MACRRRVYTHHYEQYMEHEVFTHASEVVADITELYHEVDRAAQQAPPPPQRLRPRGIGFL